MILCFVFSDPRMFAMVDSNYPVNTNAEYYYYKQS